MVGVISFPAPAKLINLNDRLHWSVKARLTAAWREAAFYAAKQAGVRNIGPSKVYVRLPVKTAHKRDPHNFTPTVKAIVDGLVDAGVWPDDNSDWVTVAEPALAKDPIVVVRFLSRVLAEEGTRHG